jgi:hypothetical protein
MNGLTTFLTADHERLETLRSRAAADSKAYQAFRRGLLKHVAMEEAILLPAVRRLRGAPLAWGQQIHRGHGALSALMTLSPSPHVVSTLRAILKVHNKLEEGNGGIYAQCEHVLGAEAARVFEALKAAPDAPPVPFADTPKAVVAVNRALEAAGYAPLP